jgi:bifunctional non-homologous end joining protein LigD
MRVDDHALSHLDFEDTTPVEGVPDATRVRIWDRGTYEAEEFGEEMVIVTLRGDRLDNRYAIFAAGENWLVHLMSRRGDVDDRA